MAIRADGGRTGTKGMPRRERERLILSAASREFGAATYAGTSLVTIATRAGVSKALVISYFGSKELVYIACVERAGAKIFDAIAGGLDSTEHRDGTGGTGGEPVLRAIFHALEAQPSDWRVVYDRSLPEGPARDAARRVRSALRAQALEGVGRAVGAVGLRDESDLLAATMVWESTVSSLMDWWHGHPDESADAMTARARRVLAALGGRPPG